MKFGYKSNTMIIDKLFPYKVPRKIRFNVSKVKFGDYDYYYLSEVGTIHPQPLPYLNVTIHSVKEYIIRTPTYLKWAAWLKKNNINYSIVIEEDLIENGSIDYKSEYSNSYRIDIFIEFDNEYDAMAFKLACLD